MRNVPIVKLLLVFAIAFSLASLPGPMSSAFHLPIVQPVRANVAPSEAWYPAGPAMNTELAPIFTDETAEFTCFNSASPCVDITDWPLTPTLIGSLTPNPNYFVTPTISETGYFEIQFMLANNFWGVNFNFGNNPNGTLIRQGIAHLVDKVAFTNNQPNIAGHSQPIDNPLPLNNGGLSTPNTCGWDSGLNAAVNFTQTGPGCVVGPSNGQPGTPTGGTSYHLAAATGVNFLWQPALGSPDFCAAAQHFIAAGLATGKDATTCVLTGIAPSVTAHTVNIFIRIDNAPRFQLGQSVAQEICALFGQGFATGCSPYLTVTPGPITAFPGFITSPTSVNLSWHIYTAGYGQVYPFDSSLFFIYNSRFVSGISTIKQSGGGFCRNDSVGSFSASNYMYLCNLNYDSLSSQMESSTCTSAPGDPTPGSAIATWGECPGTRPQDFVLTSNANSTSTTTGTTAFTISVASIGAFSGPVTLTLGAPTTNSTATAAFTVNTVSVAASSNAQTTLNVNGIPATGHTSVTITATATGTPTHKIVLITSDPANIDISATVSHSILGDDPGFITIPQNFEGGLSAIWDTEFIAISGSSTYSGTLTVTPVAGSGAGSPTPSTTVNCPGGSTDCAGFVKTTFTNADGNPFRLGFNIPSNTPKGLYSVQITVTDTVTGATATFVKYVLVPNLDAISAGLSAEIVYGHTVPTIPIYIQLDQFGYLSNWQRVINSAGSGIPQYYTWLSAWSPNPTVSGTIRQAFKQNIKSVSPYIESTVWDAYVFGNIFDSLGGTNPAQGAQLLNWMGVSEQTFTCTTATCPGTLGYTPPGGTIAAARISLRAADLFWQNDASGSHPAKRVTSWDVAFSYLSLLGTGAFNSGGASPTTGVTIISPSTFDLDLSSLGVTTLLFELGLPILPGQYWSGAGQSTWNSSTDNTISTCSNQPTASAVVACFRAQYTLSSTAVIGTSTVPAVVCADSTISSGASGCSHVPGSLLNVDTTKIGATYDPVASGILIGSGPWQAVTSGVVGGGTGVTPCGAMVCQTSPSYTLQRFCTGTDCNSPGSGLSGHYFRSSGNLAIWVWTGNNGQFTHDFSQELQVVRGCNGVTPVPAACVHWTHGIVGNGGTAITSTQISAVNRFVAVNWVGGTSAQAFDWNTAPPTGIVALPPVLYEGGNTLNPCSIDPTNGYNC